MRIFTFSLLLFVSCNSSAELPNAAEVNRKLQILIQKASHCRAEERIVFSCNFENGKTVSVCSSNNLKTNSGYVQYRYGTLGKIELTLPQKGKTNSSTIGFKHDMGASDWAYYLRFTNWNYKYFVYAGSRRGSDDPMTGASTRIETSGLAIMNDEKIIQNHKCSIMFDQMSEQFLNGNVPTLIDRNDISPFDFSSE